MAFTLKYSLACLNQARTIAGLTRASLLNRTTSCQQSTNVSLETSIESPMKAEKVSKAMRAYIERAKNHDEFMQIQDHEYKIGKRHLANMMGEDPETFTQDDVDNAIAYLFPSGLYDKRARPLMKSPEQVFPQRKAAEFDSTGRPYHSLFYTGKANFFKLLFDIVEHINKANEFEDRMISKRTSPDLTLTLDLSGTQWMNKDELQLVLVEDIADIEYNNFINAITRLVDLPYSYKSKDFIMSFRKPLMAQTNMYDVLQPQYDEQGRMFVTTYECLRKRARADVTIRSPGTGLVTINGQDLTYFDDIQPKEQVSPLFFFVQHCLHPRR